MAQLEQLLEVKQSEQEGDSVRAIAQVHREKERALLQCAEFRKVSVKYEAIARHLTGQLAYLESGFESEIALAKALYGFIGSASFETPAKTGYMTKQGNTHTHTHQTHQDEHHENR